MICDAITRLRKQRHGVRQRHACASRFDGLHSLHDCEFRSRHPLHVGARRDAIGALCRARPAILFPSIERREIGISRAVCRLFRLLPLPEWAIFVRAKVRQHHFGLVAASHAALGAFGQRPNIHGFAKLADSNVVSFGPRHQSYPQDLAMLLNRSYPAWRGSSGLRGSPGCPDSSESGVPRGRSPRNSFAVMIGTSPSIGSRGASHSAMPRSQASQYQPAVIPHEGSSRSNVSLMSASHFGQFMPGLYI